MRWRGSTTFVVVRHSLDRVLGGGSIHPTSIGEGFPVCLFMFGAATSRRRCQDDTPGRLCVEKVDLLGCVAAEPDFWQAKEKARSVATIRHGGSRVRKRFAPENSKKTTQVIPSDRRTSVREPARVRLPGLLFCIGTHRIRAASLGSFG